MNSTAEIIRSTLSMPDVARFYGFEPNRGGFITCPFHGGDDTPSLKVYPGNRGWHCFGCGLGGSVIDFVMQLFHIPFRAAVVRLNHDFNLSVVSDDRPDPEQLRRLRAAQTEKRRQQEAWDAEYLNKTIEYRRLWAAMKRGDPEDPEYAEACHKLPLLEQWFEDNPYDTRTPNI